MKVPARITVLLCAVQISVVIAAPTHLPDRSHYKAPRAPDPEEIIIDFRESRVVDMSAIEALNKITERYMRVGKKVHLRHLSPDCQKLLQNADKIIDVNVLEDPSYKVLVDKV